MRDNQGLAVTLCDTAALTAYNYAVAEWLDYKITAMRRLKQAIEIDADFCMAHCFRGYLFVTFNSAAVLPAAFYTVGWAYYLHRGEPRFVHAGPSSWEYYPRGDDFVRIYGPIRSFGIPLESLAGHVDVRRLWVCVFREVIFDQPEFDEALPEHVLGALDQRTERLKRWRLPHLDLHLYASEAPNPWAGGRRVQVDTQRLYRSLRWLPAALDPESLREVVRNARPIRLRLPSPTPIGPVPIRIAGAPADAPPASVRLEGGSLQFDSGAWTGTIVVERSDLFDVTIHRTGAALAWPLTIEVGR